MKEEMIKFLKEAPLPLYFEEKEIIEGFIKTFFDQYQPEQHKREDFIKETAS